MTHKQSQAHALSLRVLTSRAFVIFALFWCWEAVLLYVPSIHNEGIGTSLLWNISNYGSFVFCLVLMATSRKTLHMMQTLLLRIPTVLLLEIGALATVAISFFAQTELTAWQYAFCVADSIVISAGILLMNVTMVYLLMEYPSQANRAAIVIGSMAAHLLLYLLIDNLPPYAIMVCVFVLPLLVAALLKSSKQLKPAQRVAVQEVAKEVASTERAPSFPAALLLVPLPKRPKLPVPLKYLLIFFSLGLSFNFIRNAMLAQAGSDDYFSNSAVIALTLLLFALGALAEALFATQQNKTVIPVVVTVFITLALFMNQVVPSQKTLILALTFAGFFLYVTMFYCTAANYASLQKESLVKISAAVFAANMLGLSTGSLLWNIVGLVQGEITPVLSLVLAYLIFIAGIGLFLAGNAAGNLAVGAAGGAVGGAVGGTAGAAGGAPMGTETGGAASGANGRLPLIAQGAGNTGTNQQAALSLAEVLMLDCALLAKDRLLTKRECEILCCMARRRNYLQIAAEMQVSTNTVKSHMRHIYQKLGIHSAEELFEQLEEIDARRVKML